MRDRFIVGAGNNYSVDATGGSADATLVSHSHTTNSTIEESSNTAKSLTGSFRNELHSGPATGIFSQQSQNYNEDSSSGNNGYTVSIDATHRHTTDSQGNSATNANLPPYYALCYIIKHTATSGSGGSGGGTSDVAKITAISGFPNLTLNKNIKYFIKWRHQIY